MTDTKATKQSTEFSMEHEKSDDSQIRFTHAKMLSIRQDTLLGELREDTALFSYRTATKDQEVDANESSLQMLSPLQLPSKIQTCVHVLLFRYRRSESFRACSKWSSTFVMNRRQKVR